MNAIGLLASWVWASVAIPYLPNEQCAVTWLRVEQWRGLSPTEALVLRNLIDQADRPKGATPWLH